MGTVGLDDLTNVDLALETTISSQTDHYCLVIIWIMMIHMFSLLRFTLFLDFHVLNRFITILSAFHTILLKHMVSKRMNCIPVKAKESDNVLELLTSTRPILGINKKVNEFFFLRMTNSVVYGLLTFLHCLSAYWRTYGLRKDTDNFEYISPVLALLVQGHIITELFCLGERISRISTCVSI
ncbi:hypothetical protein J6590_081912 [Homalodisca vitripennis]|nr:hypothetical protein J6590_081909 [Homalodisca vitripennis]KAG8280459.1 hypothetical protein J6590_081912 [Homalodisca vitripennis]